MNFDDDTYMTREFQVSILSLIIRDRKLGLAYGDKLKPDDFSGFALQWYAKAIGSFIREYGATPTFPNLRSLLKKAVKQKGINSKQIPEIVNIFEELEIPPSNVKFLETQLQEFIRLSLIDDALIAVANARQRHEVDDAEQELRKLLNDLQVGTDFAPGTNFFSISDVKKRTKKRLAAKSAAIPTKTPLDNYLRNGGLNYGELGVILAPPGTGKTFALIHFAKVAANRGKAVVFISLEMVEDAITQRFESSVLGIPLDDVPYAGAAITRKMSSWWRRNSNRLFIKDFDSGECSPEIIKQYLDNLKEIHGVVPDLLCVDYADLMKASSRYEQRYEELNAIYRELINLSRARYIATWTASQPTTRAIKKKMLGLDDFGGSSGKGQIAPVVIGLCQDQAEAAAETMRLAIVKNRGGKSRISVQIETDFSRAQFCKRSS